MPTVSSYEIFGTLVILANIALCVLLTGRLVNTRKYVRAVNSIGGEIELGAAPTIRRPPPPPPYARARRPRTRGQRIDFDEMRTRQFERRPDAPPKRATWGTVPPGARATRRPPPPPPRSARSDVQTIPYGRIRLQTADLIEC